MSQVYEFIIRHWMLVSSLVTLIVALIILESKRGGAVISAQKAVNLINKQQAIVLDLRESSEFVTGHITQALNLPYIQLKAGEHKKTLESFKGHPVILVCKMGQHSSAIGNLLKAQGVVEVYRLEGGLQGWLNEKMPLVKG